jgi:hypothetical protein
LRVCVSLVCGELVEARGLAVVLRQAATALLVEDPETGLREGISLICGELVETRGLAVVLRTPMTRRTIFLTARYHTTVCTTGSRIVGMPSGRSPPFALGIITRRTGSGR